MTNTALSPVPSFTLSGNQPLIGIPFEENGQAVVRYFSEETQADTAVSEDTTHTALDLAVICPGKKRSEHLIVFATKVNRRHLLILIYEKIPVGYLSPGGVFATEGASRQHDYTANSTA